ncbi:MAG: hypothetical protein SGJ18_01695 [Pseudomonadota bacterium]|nr:hypothetical protein [Pseudomonadota bacterium]
MRSLIKVILGSLILFSQSQAFGNPFSNSIWGIKAIVDEQGPRSTGYSSDPQYYPESNVSEAGFSGPEGNGLKDLDDGPNYLPFSTSDTDGKAAR